jgi:hypothetical protein
VIAKDPINNTIMLNKPIDTPKVFVYGSHVQDFNVLDKTYIYTLNICATQTLTEKIKQLKARINAVCI